MVADERDSMPCLWCGEGNRDEHDRWAAKYGQPHEYEPAAGFCDDCEVWVDAEHYRVAGYSVPS